MINGIGLVLRIWAYDALFVIGSSFCELDQSWLIPWEFSLFSSFVPCRNICSSWIPAIRSWCENDLFPKFSASTFAEGARKWKAKPSNIFQESQPVSFCFCSYVAVIILESFSYCSRTSLHKNRCLYSPRKISEPCRWFLLGSKSGMRRSSVYNSDGDRCEFSGSDFWQNRSNGWNVAGQVYEENPISTISRTLALRFRTSLENIYTGSTDSSPNVKSPFLPSTFFVNEVACTAVFLAFRQW